jgi:glucan phosphoethanolaminetransferase (alkaline phosphatase superfamily)
LKERFSFLAAALWWGSLTTIGFLVVPMLFSHLATPAIAGAMAAKLFTAQTWVSIGCALLLLMARSDRDSAPVMSAQGGILFILAGLLLALLAEYAVAPRIVARENLRLWHGVGSAMYLAQWACAAIVLWKRTRRPQV